MLNTDVEVSSPPKPFKFFRMWTAHPTYDEILKTAWDCTSDEDLEGLYCRLRNVKIALKTLNKEAYSNIRARVSLLASELDKAHNAVMDNPSVDNMEVVAALTDCWNTARTAEESFLKQKARENWVNLGDSNTKFFHSSLKCRQAYNQIVSLNTADGRTVRDLPEIINEAVGFYEKLLGTPDCSLFKQTDAYFEELLIHKIPADDANSLCSPVSDEEIKSALFSMRGDKSPGPDGFSAFFFQNSWDLVGKDFTSGVRFFFESSSMPRKVNATTLALIPKVQNASSMAQFRPISCCNVLYKCITKILANRIGEILPLIISNSQSAFVKGRIITDNVLMAQELVNSYHLGNVSPRCVLKADLMKAFDSVDWHFLFSVLRAMRFPAQFITWVEVCLSSAMFSVSINGGLCGFFQAKKGLRQGDPLSPLLFVIAMEVLHYLFYRLAVAGIFPFHPRCKKLGITHLCFADDLMIFTTGSVVGVRRVCSIVHSFYLLSGLKVNPAKSELYCSKSVPTQMVDAMISITGFVKGSLPVRYLGVPLISGSLSSKHCQTLVDRIIKRVNSWSAKLLSYAGKAQIIDSILLSMCQYWMNVFILPRAVIKEVENACNRFLWGVTGTSKRAKVSWKTIARPRSEGGIGLRELQFWNFACSSRHIWSFILCSGSLWVAWVKTYRLKQKDIWTYTASPSSAWFWKQLLKARDIIFPHITQKLDGSYLWNGSPLPKFSVIKIWEAIRPKSNEVFWCNFIWQKPSIPSHSFINWLLVNDKIVTKDKLASWGVVVDLSCLLCSSGLDTRNHLFCECSYIKQVRQLCKVDNVSSSNSWDSSLQEVVSVSSHGGAKAATLRLMWRAINSHVWKERCRRVFGNSPLDSNALSALIRREFFCVVGVTPSLLGF
ncbi:LINE-1 retrotransposable element ORF2 protein [Linum perenne]